PPKASHGLHLPKVEDPFLPLYRTMVEAIEKDSAVELETAFALASSLRDRYGLKNLSEYSRALLTEASQTADPEDRSALIGYAKALSPSHPFIRYEAAKILEGNANWDSLKLLGSSFWTYPSLLIPFLSSLIYPILLALTFAVILTAAYILISYPRQVLRPLARFGFELDLPKRFAIIVVPAVVVAMFLGPLACLTCFAILLAPSHRYYFLFAGLLLALWGVLIPVHENVSTWEKSDGMQSVFRIVEQDQGPGDIYRVYEMFEARSDDPLVLAALVQLMVREKEYQTALFLLAMIEDLNGERAWTDTNRGVILFIEGKFKEAKEYLESAHDRDRNSAEALFWLSKIEFELLDTDTSTELYSKARKIDEELVKSLEKIEVAQGQGKGWMGKSFAPPWAFYRASSFVPNDHVKLQSQRKLNHLFYPLSPGLLVVLGLAILGSAVIALTRRHAEKGHGIEESDEANRLVAICPGGSLAASRHTMLSLPFSVALFLTLFLALGWPSECGRFFGLFPELAPVVLFFAGCFVLLSYPLGWLLRERRKG
ncbi:MAG: tetratricopeptide repeat protein, partial [Bdellovibrionales bacterium]|nr:tetratricopeptide repeat protein [Bdellovibrionales bacterium]